MDLSIVIVNHDTHALLEDCLKSVFEQTRRVSFEVFVVDNSRDQSAVRPVVERFPGVELILQERNSGFAAANNEAIRRSSGRWVLLLNADTWLLDGTLDKVVEFGRSRSRAGAIGCRVLNPDRTLQRSCFTFPGLLNLFLVSTYLHALFPRSRLFGRAELTWWDYDDEREVDFVKGCFLMANREAIAEVGLLDEDYFVYGEEADWCRRMKQRGWPTVYTPCAEIVHIGEGSTRNVARAMLLQYWGSLLLFVRKHHGRVYHFFCALLVFSFFSVRLLPWLLKALVGPRDSRGGARIRALAYADGMYRLAFRGAGSLCHRVSPPRSVAS